MDKLEYLALLKTTHEDQKEVRDAKLKKEGVTAILKDISKDLNYDVCWGTIEGDVRERFRDGQVIHTSLIDRVEEIEGLIYAYTLNSVYLLDSFRSEEEKEKILKIGK